MLATLFSESLNTPAERIPVNLGLGFAYGPHQVSAAVTIFRVPDSVTLSTGLTCELMVSDDPINPDPGKTGVFGVTVGPFTSGVSQVIDTEAPDSPLDGSAEVVATVTLSPTIGVLSIFTINVPTAAMNGLAPGDWCMLRVRRLATDQRDSHGRRIVLLNVDTRDT
jgi:hypothetical protein